MTKKIAILKCSNTANEVACPSVGCLDSLEKGEGLFERYGSGGAKLVGLINCAGCPTTKAPTKILRQVRSLKACGAEAIHLSSCMTMLCPFKNKYTKVIREAYPDLEVIEGTHVAPEPVEQAFFGFITECVGGDRKGMADLMGELQKMMPPQE